MRDAELWDKIRAQHVSAFDAFYRENAPRLKGFLRQIVGSPQAAEDVAQETFAELWSRPNGYHPDRGTMRAYLFGIGRKHAAEWWRQQRPSEPTPQEQSSDGRAEMRLLVGEAFQQLPEEQRTLLWLREVEGYSYAELASTLGIHVGTVRSRLFAARQVLRAIWLRERRSE